MPYFVGMDDMQHPVIGFGLDYAGELIFCEAVMHDDHYEVLFDGKWIANVLYNDDMEWKQSSGTILTEKIIAEIGFRIDSNYK